VVGGGGGGGGKGGRCVGLSTLPPSCVDCVEIWEPHRPGALRACIGIALPLPLLVVHLIKLCKHIFALN